LKDEEDYRCETNPLVYLKAFMMYRILEGSFILDKDWKVTDETEGQSQEHRPDMELESKEQKSI